MKPAPGHRRLFYWCHTTVRQNFETGIQRVTRRLAQGFTDCGIAVVPVGLDERSRLVEVIGGGTAAFEAALAEVPGPGMLFVPELTADLVASGADPLRLGRAYGLRGAVLVHDLIPLKLRDHYAPGVVAMFELYYRSLGGADLVLATSHSVAADLRAFLDGERMCVPPIAIVPLPAQFGDRPRVTEAGPKRRVSDRLTLVAITTWEPRKNLLGLLSALALAQRLSPVEIALEIVGRRGLFPDHDREVEAALRAKEGARAHDGLSDAALADLVAAADATIYPSVEEGFGMPIGESLWLGRGCICHNGSAMAELAGEGTMAIDMTDETAIVDALLSLARDPEAAANLAAAARRRPLADWRDYAQAVAVQLSQA